MTLIFTIFPDAQIVHRDDSKFRVTKDKCSKEICAPISIYRTTKNVRVCSWVQEYSLAYIIVIAEAISNKSHELIVIIFTSFSLPLGPCISLMSSIEVLILKNLSGGLKT